MKKLPKTIKLTWHKGYKVFPSMDKMYIVLLEEKYHGKKTEYRKSKKKQNDNQKIKT